MSQPLRDDAVYRTRQAWLRTGLGAAGVAALGVRAALLGEVNVPALVIALTGVSIAIGVGVQRRRGSRSAVDFRSIEAWLVTAAILLLGAAGVLLAVG